MKSRAILLIPALLFAFLFGGVVHALVPHDHDGSELVWQEMHASLRHESTVLVVSSVAMLLAIPLVVTHARPAYARAPRGRRERFLERGIAQHRRFG